jgi:hypothetical protein
MGYTFYKRYQANKAAATGATGTSAGAYPTPSTSAAIPGLSSILQPILPPTQDTGTAPTNDLSFAVNPYPAGFTPTKYQQANRTDVTLPGGGWLHPGGFSGSGFWTPGITKTPTGSFIPAPDPASIPPFVAGGGTVYYEPVPGVFRAVTPDVFSKLSQAAPTPMYMPVGGAGM